MRIAPDLRTVKWRKSSYSGGTSAECVEVGDNIPGLVPVRDSKNATGDVLVFQAAAWSCFVAAAARELRAPQ